MRRHRILLVEDDSTLATLYRSALSYAGFDVDVAGDGITALEDIDEDHPDLIVLGTHVPQLAGEIILREVAATPDTRDIPVIVVTRTDAAAPAASAIPCPPCDPRELVALVTRHLS